MNLFMPGITAVAKRAPAQNSRRRCSIGRRTRRRGGLLGKTRPQRVLKNTQALESLFSSRFQEIPVGTHIRTCFYVYPTAHHPSTDLLFVSCLNTRAIFPVFGRTVFLGRDRGGGRERPRHDTIPPQYNYHGYHLRDHRNIPRLAHSSRRSIGPALALGTRDDWILGTWGPPHGGAAAVAGTR